MFVRGSRLVGPLRPLLVARSDPLLPLIVRVRVPVPVVICRSRFFPAKSRKVRKMSEKRTRVAKKKSENHDEQPPQKKAKVTKAKKSETKDNAENGAAKPKTSTKGKGEGKAEAKAKGKGKGKSKAKDQSEGKEGGDGGSHDHEKPKFPIVLFKNALGYSMAYNVLYVSNMKKSIEFYTKVYGFELREGNGDQPWAALHTGNTALALHAVESKKKAAASSKDARPGQAGPGFFVPDIAAFHKRAIENGAVCLEEPKQEPWGGVKALYADPDGIIQSIVEVKDTSIFNTA